MNCGKGFLVDDLILNLKDYVRSSASVLCIWDFCGLYLTNVLAGKSGYRTCVNAQVMLCGSLIFFNF